MAGIVVSRISGKAWWVMPAEDRTLGKENLISKSVASQNLRMQPVKLRLVCTPWWWDFQIWGLRYLCSEQFSFPFYLKMQEYRRQNPLEKGLPKDYSTKKNIVFVSLLANRSTFFLQQRNRTWPGKGPGWSLPPPPPPHQTKSRIESYTLLPLLPPTHKKIIGLWQKFAKKTTWKNLFGNISVYKNQPVVFALNRGCAMCSVH